MPQEWKKLTPHFRKELFRSDAESLAKYGSDWLNRYTPNACAVAFPRTTTEVSELLKLCSEHNLAVIPSGGRTGLVGGTTALHQELVVSLEKMNQVVEFDPLGATICVETGMTTQALNEFCQKEGLHWPLDLAAKGTSQIGGNLATNAGGIRVVRYGSIRHWVLGLTAVLMDGTVLEMGGSVEKNNTGLDLKQLFIGSEGTLGVLTQATLKLTPLASETTVFLIAMDSMKSALQVLKKIRPLAGGNLLAFEYFSHHCLKAVCQKQGEVFPIQETDHYLLIEVQTERQSPPWCESILETTGIVDSALANSSQDQNRLWAVRENISESLGTLGRIHKNDVCVPISKLDSLTDFLEGWGKMHYGSIPVFVYGHLGDGNLHINAVAPSAEIEWENRCHKADQELFQTIEKFGGSISAEHGIGISKKADVPFSQSAAQISLAKKIKAAFDPKGLMNPGKFYP